jgi:hypothetical protein
VKQRAGFYAGAQIMDDETSGENQGTMDWGSAAERCGESPISKDKSIRFFVVCPVTGRRQ